MKSLLRKIADRYSIEELDVPMRFRAVLDSRKHIYFSPIKVREDRYTVEVKTKGGQITFFKDVSIVLCILY